jgi:uncharacterized damage-inducible protein DinB
MDHPKDFLVWAIMQAQREFDGHAFNGSSLMETFRSLDAQDAASTDTWEGYSAWSVANHVCYYKYFMIKAIDAAQGSHHAAALEPWTGPENAETPAPENANEIRWAGMLGLLEATHQTVMDVIRHVDTNLLGKILPSWNVPFGEAIAWLLNHDSYHAAQIRSMGIPALRDKILIKDREYKSLV